VPQRQYAACTRVSKGARSRRAAARPGRQCWTQRSAHGAARCAHGIHTGRCGAKRNKIQCSGGSGAETVRRGSRQQRVKIAAADPEGRKYGVSGVRVLQLRARSRSSSRPQVCALPARWYVRVRGSPVRCACIPVYVVRQVRRVQCAGGKMRVW